MKLVDQVGGALALVQAGIDIARSKGDSVQQVLTLNETLQSLREQLLAVREQVTALASAKAELAERLAQRARFEHERGSFTLTKLQTGSVVYVRDYPGRRSNEAPIYYCAHCFKRGEQEILQIHAEQLHRDPYKCHACGSTDLIPNDRRMRVY